MPQAPTQPSNPTVQPPAPATGEGSGPLQPMVWNAGQILLRTVSVLAFRMRTYGLHNIPTTGPALLVTNHQSFLDPWLIAVPLRRQVHYMARESLFRGGFGQTMLELTNAFPVRRGKADVQAIRAAILRLQKGYILNVFPESTRTVDGTIGPIAGGLSTILNRVQTPVIPVLVDGAFEAWPRSQKWPHAATIRISYGAPIDHEQLAALTPAEAAVRLRWELVQLQKEIGSAHAQQSEQRFAADIAAGRTRLAGPEMPQ